MARCGEVRRKLCALLVFWLRRHLSKSAFLAVWHIVGYYYKVGMSAEDILGEWDYLKPAQVFSALAYYHDNKQEIDTIREENSYKHWKQEQDVPVTA